MSSSETTIISPNNHSLNERNVESKEDNYRRDSFDDRFCDDLCEDILQYLSLENKLRLQCVSKQFQRTVFQRQDDLYINMSPEEHIFYLNNRFSIRRDHNYYYIEDQSLHSFKALLKKCPNITSIQLERQEPEKFNQVFRLIIENCNNLSEVIVENDINDSNFEEFHRKFGPKIKYLRSLREPFDLNLFPNIKKLRINNVHDESIAQLKLAKPKLKDLHFGFEKGQGEENILHKIVDIIPKLKHLKVYFLTEDDISFHKSLKNISNLKHLIHFECIELKKTNERFFYLLKQMAKNCRNLKSIFCFFKNDVQNSDIKQFLSQMIAFPALKRLNLITYCDD